MAGESLGSNPPLMSSEINYAHLEKPHMMDAPTSPVEKEATPSLDPIETSAPAPSQQAEEELVQRELSLAELVALMDEYRPLIPDALNDYYMAKAGLYCPDPRIKRVIALAAQKFIADVATDALHFCKLRQQTIQGRRPSKYVLSIEDLASALAEYGVHIRKPEYYS